MDRAVKGQRLFEESAIKKRTQERRKESEKRKHVYYRVVCIPTLMYGAVMPLLHIIDLPELSLQYLRIAAVD